MVPDRECSRTVEVLRTRISVVWVIQEDDRRIGEVLVRGDT